MDIHLIAVNGGHGKDIRTVYFALNEQSYAFMRKAVAEKKGQKIIVETEASMPKQDWNRIVKLLKGMYLKLHEVRLQDDELVFIYDLEGKELTHYQEQALFKEIMGRLPKPTAERLNNSIGVMELLR